MGDNFYTPFVNGTTVYNATVHDQPFAALDKAITYGTNKPIIHCDGDLSWVSGTLAWSNNIRILFNTAAGKVVQNTINTGSIALSDNEFCYVTLNETDGTVLTVSKASITPDAASNFIALGILVLGYRNTASDDIFLSFLVKPHHIQEEAGSVLARRPKINFVGLSVTASDNSGNNSTDVTIRNGIPKTSVVAYAATISIDLNNYNIADITLTGNPTINFTNGIDGQTIIIRLRQDVTGTRLVTWGSMCRFSTDTPTPTLTTTPSTLDYLAFRYNSIDSKYDFVAINHEF